MLEKENTIFKQGGISKVGEDVDEKLKQYYQEYALYGGYPRVVTARDEEENLDSLIPEKHRNDG